VKGLGPTAQQSLSTMRDMRHEMIQDVQGDQSAIMVSLHNL